MKRRRFLALASAAVPPVVAGCTGTTDETGADGDADSDDDGVVDSEDYAPNDPDVQEKADVSNPAAATTTTAIARTPTPDRPAPSSTTARVTRTTTASATTEQRSVTDDYWDGLSRITAYGPARVDVRLRADSRLDGVDRVSVGVGVSDYPTGETHAFAESSTLPVSGFPRDVALDVDTASAPTGERLFYYAAFFPDGSASDRDPIPMLSTDPVRLARDRSRLLPDPHPDDLGPASDGGFERQVVEGQYNLALTGRTMGRSWRVGLTLSKSGYLAAKETDHGRARPEFVTYEMTQGQGRALARLLAQDAADNGFTGKREQVEFVIDVVQRLPYVPDDVSTGYDDYTKFIAETVAEGAGDCEDTSILLASVLQAEPFGYDTVLLQPPGHMAVGIRGADDLPGYYFEYDGARYYYIETTGEGWGIGDLPEEYRDDRVLVHQV